MINKKNKGFTLAEVLITLVIIGVIASMTIPTLINKTNKQEYVSRLKKAYSTMAQATGRIIAEEGNPKASIGGWATSVGDVFEMYRKYLSNAKVCGIDTTGCFQGPYTHYNGSTVPDFDDGKYTLVMADGTEISFRDGDFSTTCSKNGQGSIGVCQIILLDINGAKGPNKVGRDAFSFSLKPDGLVPTGCDGSACSGAGWGCTCKVLREGAINY